MTKYRFFFITFFISVILDQATKVWIESYYKCPGIPSIQQAARQGKLENIPEISVIDGVFSFSHAHNQGAAFGIMQGQMLIFAIFTLIAVVWIGYTVHTLHKDDRSQSFALALIGSGAIGNAIDRVRLGYVVDFLRLYTDDVERAIWLRKNFGMAEWPSFNVADSAIVIGMIWFFIHGLFLVGDSNEIDDELAGPDIYDENEEQSSKV